MGSPLGPALANRLTFLCAVLKVNGFTPVFYRRYINDIFVLFSSPDHADKCRKHLFLRSGIGYKFQCGSCNDNYYGKTKRHFKVRMYEHLWISALTGKNGGDDSAITEHLWFCNHTPGFEYFSILATNNNDFKVALMESFLINRDHPPLSKNKQSLFLVLFDSLVTGSSLFQFMVTSQI